MRLLIFVFLTSALMPAPAYAENVQIKKGPVPVWASSSELLAVPQDASGAIFIRRQDSLVHLDKSGQAQHFSYRIKILHPNALELGNIAISWNPEWGSPLVHAINIYRGNETIDVLNASSFEILRREDQLEAAKLDGNLTAVLRVPDLRVGDELEVSFTTPISDPTLGGNNNGVLALAPAPAPGRYHLGLSWGKGLEPMLKMTPDMTAVEQHSENAVDFRFDNPASLTLPNDAPPRYNWQRIVEYSTFKDWAEISRHFAPLYAKASKLGGSSPLKSEASRIAAEHAQPLERASAALKLVQQDVRYIYVGLNGGNLVPATADETWQRRYGDCKGKTAMLLALLSELGIEAQAVLVNNGGGDDGLDERLPSPGMFDHVLVRAQIDGKAYWLDGTMPPVVPPGLDPVLGYKWALPLTQQGSTIEHLAWKPAERPDSITMFEIDARAGFDQPARITSTTIARGLSGIQQEVQLSGLTHDQLVNGFRQQMTGGMWQAIEDVRWRYDQKAQASVLTVVGTGTIDWDDDGNGARSTALPGGGFNAPERRTRPAGKDQDLPYYNKPEFDCRVTTLLLPSATNVKNWSFKPGYDMKIYGKHYYRAFELFDGSIRMIRGFRVDQEEIGAASVQQDNARLNSFDNSMAWVFYDPDSAGFGNSKKMSVPATFDIDWTKDIVPCLPSKMAK